MFLDREITAELQRELQKQSVVIAHNRDEAWKKGQEIKSIFRCPCLGVPTDHEALALEIILDKWKGYNTPWSVLKGMKVLDLASGSAGKVDEYCTWYPHFSRLCAINGADVVAIDIYPQQGID